MDEDIDDFDIDELILQVEENNQVESEPENTTKQHIPTQLPIPIPHETNELPFPIPQETKIEKKEHSNGSYELSSSETTTKRRRIPPPKATSGSNLSIFNTASIIGMITNANSRA